jgi:hypothetical protein
MYSVIIAHTLFCGKLTHTHTHKCIHKKSKRWVEFSTSGWYLYYPAHHDRNDFASVPYCPSWVAFSNSTSFYACFIHTLLQPPLYSVPPAKSHLLQMKWSLPNIWPMVYIHLLLNWMFNRLSGFLLTSVAVLEMLGRKGCLHTVLKFCCAAKGIYCK